MTSVLRGFDRVVCPSVADDVGDQVDKGGFERCGEGSHGVQRRVAVAALKETHVVPGEARSVSQFVLRQLGHLAPLAEGAAEGCAEVELLQASKR